MGCFDARWMEIIITNSNWQITPNRQAGITSIPEWQYFINCGALGRTWVRMKLSKSCGVMTPENGQLHTRIRPLKATLASAARNITCLTCGADLMPLAEHYCSHYHSHQTPPPPLSLPELSKKSPLYKFCATGTSPSLEMYQYDFVSNLFG